MDTIGSDNFSNLEIDITGLPRYEQVNLHSISKKYLIKLQIGTTLTFMIFAAGLIAGYIFMSSEFHNYIFAGGGLLLLLLGWSFFNNLMYVKKSGYGLREKDIIFKRGFLFRRTTIVPFNRIQHVTVERSFLDKILKIATIKVFTAGGSGSDVSIPGISPSIAHSVKEEISARISNHA